ncbi:hypothetical protein HYD72_03835 [Mycoplasmopsis bovis]|nr:hypothetical protein [Mycoplasmopsis bovis]QQH49388.1 hypothetical protein HYD72_03835 [Mycoplasmopsis bovis]
MLSHFYPHTKKHQKFVDVYFFVTIEEWFYISKTEKTNIGIIDENKKKELLKELDKQFSISPDYNVIEKAFRNTLKK